MKWKHLFIDLDGTTIKSDPHAVPTERVIQTIHKLQNILPVSIATGRTLSKALPIIEMLHISSICITANGIQLYDPKKQMIIHEHSVSRKRLHDVLSMLLPFGHVIHAFNGETDSIVKDNYLPEKSLSLFLLGLTHKETSVLMEKITHFFDIAVHRMPSWKGDHFEDMEICHVQATKLHRLREVCAFYNIHEYECIAAGDGLNDYEMLMAAGLKITMENGHPELKKVADIIAPPVEEDGLAIVLETLLLN